MQPSEHSPRLKRLDRLFFGHPIYFVTACTENRQRILANEQIHTRFRDFCAQGMERGIFVGSYVIMPDHLHLFVTVPEPGEATQNKHEKDSAVIDRRYNLASPLSEWVKSLKNTLSKVLREKDVPSPQWQKGFFRPCDAFKPILYRKEDIRCGKSSPPTIVRKRRNVGLSRRNLLASISWLE